MKFSTRLPAFLFCFLTAGLLLLPGCTTGDGNSSRRTAYLDSLAAMGVGGETFQRITNERILRFSDVMELVKKGVSGSQIVAYMKSTRAPYNFSTAQVEQLVDAGADSTLVNFVGKASGDYLIDSQNSAAQNRLVNQAKFDKELWNSPYFMDPDYMGEPPFDFGWPVFW